MKKAEETLFCPRSTSPRVRPRGAVRGGSPFELRTAFPARTLADEAQTLAAAGLAPAATLCMRPLP